MRRKRSKSTIINKFGQSIDRRQVDSSHVGPLNADDSAGESLQLSSGQVLHVPLPQVTQIWPITMQKSTNHNTQVDGSEAKCNFLFLRYTAIILMWAKICFSSCQKARSG